MKNYRTILLAISLLLSLFSFAQSRKAFFYGLAKDHVTQEVLTKVNVSVYKDTVLVSKNNPNSNVNISGNSGFWILEIPKEGGVYRFTFLKEGYELMEKTVEVKPFKKMESLRFGFIIDMKRKAKEHKLNDVVVKATQLKFYHKGDTVVYNADAFNLAQGSMLDNLIKSIPGAELSDEGEIKVNGRKIDALLLNGEEFFKGKNRIMLENLPSYMVKTLKVYDRKDPLNVLKGRSSEGEYVMDVNLKKQYAIGFIGNAEVGMGSENRYLARLFALRFTDASRIGGYANFNNLNDKRKPGENSNWTPDKMPQGLLSQKMGGADYLFKPKHTTNKFSGNAELSYTDADNYSEKMTETYFDTRNTYAKSRSQSRNDNFNFSTSHKWELKQADGVSGLELSPYFTYSRFNRHANTLSATFDDNPYNYIKSKALLDSIQHGTGTMLRSMMLNRYERDIKSDGHSLSTGMQAFYSVLSAGFYYGLMAKINYATDRFNTFDRYDLQYPSQPSVAPQLQNTFIKNKPDRALEYLFSPVFGLCMTENSTVTNLGFFPEVGQKMKRKVLSRYNREESNLPSEIDFMQQLFDDLNSYDFHQSDNFLGGKITFERAIDKKPMGKNNGFYRLHIYGVLPLHYHHYRLDYTRGNGDVYSGITRRNAVLFSPQFYIKYLRNDSIQLRLEYKMSQSVPSMTSLLAGFEDTTDPLNIHTGNSDLKNITNHEVALLYALNGPKRQSNFTIKQSFYTTVNALAYTYVFDRTTGIRHYRPMSVNGNYTLNTNIWHWCPLDKKKKLTLKDETLLQLNHGVDYISEDKDVTPWRSTVNTWWGTEKVELKYGLGKHSVGFKGYVGVGHVTSSREDFDSYTLWDFNYGLTALLKLPLDIELSTDLTIYSHRGYATSSANTNDLVWNARLSKIFPKIGLTLLVDGFDILGNLSNYSQVINSQGRTETYFNSLPRYVMAHAIYRFNKKPKKR